MIPPTAKAWFRFAIVLALLFTAAFARVSVSVASHDAIDIAALADTAKSDHGHSHDDDTDDQTASGHEHHHKAQDHVHDTPGIPPRLVMLTPPMQGASYFRAQGRKLASEPYGLFRPPQHSPYA